MTPEARDYDPRINGSIFVLADGMGGHGGGEIASRIAVGETIRAYANTPSDVGPARRLHRAIVQANDRVLSEAASGAQDSEMGSTVVACTIRDGHMVIGHVGDSRIYLLRGGAIQQLTRDHLYVTDVLGVPESEIDEHPMKHILSRAVGRVGTEPDVKELTCQPGDRLLLCSDGVSNVVSRAEMQNALAHSGPKEAVMSIMSIAKQRARDNITAVVVSVPGRVKQPPPRLAPLLAAMAGGFVVLALMAAMLVPSGNGGPVGSAPKAGEPLTVRIDTEGRPEVRAFLGSSNGEVSPGGKFAKVVMGEVPKVSGELDGKICVKDAAKDIHFGEGDFTSAKYSYIPF